MRTDLIAFVGYQTALLAAIVIAAVSYGLDATQLSERFRGWDASWFLSIAQHGYQPSGSRPAAIAFFPLLPLLVRIAMVVVRKDVVAAFVVTSMASIAGHTLFYRSLRGRLELADSAVNATILLAAWPTTIYFSLLYSEGLYLLVTALFLFLLLRDRVGWAAMAAGLAALARQPGFLCVVPLTVWVLTDPVRPWPRRWRRAGWGVIAAAGYATYLLVNKIVYGEWFAFVRLLRQHWGKHTAPLVQTVPDAIRFVQHPDWYFGWPIVMDHWLMLAALPLLVAWPVICGRRFERCRWTLWAWGAAQWLFLASSSASTPGVGWMSSTRYLMLVLPLYVAICDLVRNRRAILLPLSAASTVVAGVVLDRWITHQWVA